MRVSAINVYSEVGKLKKVMVHRPGRDFDAVRPDTLERQLVDDVVWAEQAAKDHDVFAGHLRDIGAEVVYIEDLFEQSIGGEADRMAFLDEYLDKDAANAASKNDFGKNIIPSMLEENIKTAIEKRLKDGCGNLYVLVNYTALDPTRRVLMQMAEQKEGEA